MSRYLNLQIPAACHESWQQMTPTHNGRFCQSCQKSVVDFTSMSDDELVRYFQQHTGATCGRFTEAQLNRDLPVPRKPLPWVKYFFRYSLPAFLFMLKANVQAQICPVKTEVSPIQPRETPAIPPLVKQAISGYVMDSNGQPLVGASVLVKGTTKGTVTDTSGKYVLNNLDIPARLQVSYIGFESKELTIDSHAMISKIDLHLNPAISGNFFLGDVSSVRTINTFGGTVTVTARNKKAKKISREMKKELAANTGKPSISAYPNPVQRGTAIHLQCSQLETGTYQATLYSMSGQQVQSSTINYQTGDTNISLKLPQIKAGVYTVLLIHQKTGKPLSQQILVKD